MRIRNITQKIRRFGRYVTWRNFFITAGVGIGSIIVLAIAVYIYFDSQLPNPNVIFTRWISESTKIYDRTGEVLLYDVHGEERRTIIAWEDIPQNVKNATLASEDSDFYNHSGIDIKGIIRALYKDVTTLQASQGGSTITQQLVKNALLGKEKTFSRKIKEMIFSIKIEHRFSKDDLFWAYLNEIPYGSNAYGIEAASQTFFGKHAKELTIAESALLSALPQRTTYYSPYGKNLPILIARRNHILDRMKELKMITREELDAAIAEEPVFRPVIDSIKAPHFVIMVRDYLIETYGEEAVQSGGLKVYTTLDMDLQKKAEDVVAKYGETNAKKYKASNAAFVAQDPKTGQILAMIGSRNYFDIEHEGNFNVATSPHRQPGSSFKPFVYATAFAKGFTDSTVIFDLKTEFTPGCAPTAEDKDKRCYHPKNYTSTFSGPVTMRQALQRSLNIPAVQTLYLAGIKNSVETATKMGITTLQDPDRFGLALVLGGAEVKLVDMVQAYSVFANDGIKTKQSFILKVVGSDNSIIEEYREQKERVLDAQIARLMSDVLSDNNARAAVFGFNSPLYIPGRPVAAKTGTTNDNRDGWIIGYTPSLIAGVWTGNNDNSPMTNQGAGVSAAGPMWKEFMIQALAGKPVESFTKPRPIIAIKPILNGDYRGPDGVHTTLYYVDKNNPQGPPPSDPSQDPQFSNWEYSVMNWAFGAGEQTTPPTPSINPEPSQQPSPIPEAWVTNPPI